MEKPERSSSRAGPEPGRTAVLSATRVQLRTTKRPFQRGSGVQGAAPGGSLARMMRASIPAPKYARKTPSRLPLVASRRDSVSTCRASRVRLAPSEIRIANSCCRAAPRAKSMLAKLLHAINSSRPTMAMSNSSGFAHCSRRLDKPVPAGSTSSFIFRRKALLLVASSDCHSTLISACACVMETPGFKRPTNHSEPLWLSGRSTIGSRAKGSQMSCRLSTCKPENSRGATPITATGTIFHNDPFAQD